MMLRGFIQSDVQWFQLVCCTVMLANMIIGCFSQSALGWLYLLGCKVALASLLQGGSSVNWWLQLVCCRMDLACLLQGCFSQSYVRCLQLVCCSMALSSLLQDGSIQSAVGWFYLVCWPVLAAPPAAPAAFPDSSMSPSSLELLLLVFLLEVAFL